VGEVCGGGGGGRCTYRHRRIVAKSTRAYKEVGRASFCHFFAYVLNGRPLPGDSSSVHRLTIGHLMEHVYIMHVYRAK
jgi:hypothetical protein